MIAEQIVGLMIDGQPYAGWQAAHMFKVNGQYDRYITKKEAQLMSIASMGAIWDEMAQGPVILIMDEQGIRLNNEAAKQRFRMG